MKSVQSNQREHRNSKEHEQVSGMHVVSSNISSQKAKKKKKNKKKRKNKQAKIHRHYETF